MPEADELAKKLTTTLNLGGVSLQRITKARRDISRDSLPEQYKSLADRKHDVEDGQLFGHTVDEEFQKIAADSHTELLMAALANQKKADNSGLEKGGRAGAPQKYPSKQQSLGNYKIPKKQSEDSKQTRDSSNNSNSNWRNSSNDRYNSGYQKNKGGGDRKWQERRRDRSRDRN